MSNPSRRSSAAAISVALAILTLSCSPEVGSEAWCEKMNQTPKGDWSANDAAVYAKHCVLK
jgi:hypothetical protein